MPNRLDAARRRYDQPNVDDGGLGMLNGLWMRVQERPVAVLQLTQAVIVLVTVFGLDLTEEQTAAILGFMIVLLGFLTNKLMTANANLPHDSPSE